jgi:hypothetical protein
MEIKDPTVTVQTVTTKPIEYKAAPYGFIATIPAGSKVVPADNLPDGGYWVEQWEGMTEVEEAWGRSYGFHLTEEDFTE